MDEPLEDYYEGVTPYTATGIFIVSKSGEVFMVDNFKGNDIVITNITDVCELRKFYNYKITIERMEE